MYFATHRRIKWEKIKNIPPVICLLGLDNHSACLPLPVPVHVYYSGENNPFLPELYVTHDTIIMVFTCSQGKTWNKCPSILPYNIWKCHSGREPHQSLWRLLENGFRPAVAPSLLCPALILGREAQRTIRINARYCNPARSASLSEHCTATNQSSSHVMGKSIAAYNQ